jgi:uncharacterized protein (DUF1684 family)
MRTRGRSSQSLLGIFLCLLPFSSAGAQSPSWQADLATWRTEHSAELLKPDGWLSLVGLEWLEPGDNAFGSAPDNKIHLAAGSPAHLGILRFEKETVTLLPPADGFPRELLLEAAPAKSQALHVVADEDKLSEHLTIGTLTMYVIRRQARFALRIRDSRSPAILGFHGLKWYAPDDNYLVTANWTPYKNPKTITLTTLVGTTYDQPVPGVAEFSIGGRTYRLEPVLEDPAVSRLFFVLRDTTSATTTYSACRFLYTGFPSNGLDNPGQLVLDFNRLENPPCAYTPYSTCPLPPPGNRIPIALPVGEQRYHD